MLRRLRSGLTYANVASSIALFVALGTGGAYAADTIGSSDIINESILGGHQGRRGQDAELVGESVTNASWQTTRSAPTGR